MVNKMYKNSIFTSRPATATALKALSRQKRCFSCLLLCLSAVLILAGGCQDADPNTGYTSRNLYRTDIKTVCVRMLENKTFRRSIEFDLTSAICRQIELHCPYKIESDNSKADTVIYGQITSVDEDVLANQRKLDRPIENLVVLTVEITWKDLRSGEMLMDNQRFRLDSSYAPLLGSTRDIAAKEAADKVAVLIVGAMEKPW
jgi:hypothetical protein